MSKYLLFTMTLALVACAGSGAATKTSTTSAASSAATPTAPSPVLHYQIRDKERCRGPVIFCDKGYPFYNEQGCGCADDPVFPAAMDPLACEADADCVISYQRPNNCCGDLCTATQPYNRRAEKLLTAWHARRCGRAVCPLASCVSSTVSFKAVCAAGRCQAIKQTASTRSPQPGRSGRLATDVFACHADRSGTYFTCWDGTGKRLGTTFRDLKSDFPRSSIVQRKRWLENYKTGCITRAVSLPPSAISRFILQRSALKDHKICTNVTGERYWWRAHGGQYVFTASEHRGHSTGEYWQLIIRPASAARLREMRYPQLRCRNGDAGGDKRHAWQLEISVVDDSLVLRENNVASPTMRSAGVLTAPLFARFIKTLRCDGKQRVPRRR